MTFCYILIKSEVSDGLLKLKNILNIDISLKQNVPSIRTAKTNKNIEEKFLCKRIPKISRFTSLQHLTNERDRTHFYHKNYTNLSFWIKYVHKFWYQLHIFQNVHKGKPVIRKLYKKNMPIKNKLKVNTSFISIFTLKKEEKKIVSLFA